MGRWAGGHRAGIGSGAEGRAARAVPLALFAGVLAFYLATLAPTVLWGDGAFFQRSAAEGLLKRDAGGHWLWLRLAMGFTQLPWGNLAYRVNLLSAVAGAATIGLLWLAIRALGLSGSSALVACLSLAVAHTFWMHAVRAEVYTVFTAMMALQLWLWFTWRPERARPIQLAAALFGLTLLGHQMAVLLVPAAAYLLWRRRGWLGARGWVLLLGLLMLGLLPFAAVVAWQAQGDGLWVGVWRHFTRVDVDFTPALFDFSLSRLPRDAAMGLGLLGLQFVGLAGVLGLYGLSEIPRKSDAWRAVLILYATCVLFALSYRVNDRFVFYLPSYVAFALFVANGWQRLQRSSARRSAWVGPVAVAAIVLLPVLTYFAMSRGLARAGLNPLDVRVLPGREPNRYFLWPASQGDDGAEVFAVRALRSLPPGSVLVADHTPYEPLRYLQGVEGLRPDVRLIRIEPLDDLRPVLARLPPTSPIFLADDDPRYYRLASLPGRCPRRFGVVVRLMPCVYALGLCRTWAPRRGADYNHRANHRAVISGHASHANRIIDMPESNASPPPADPPVSARPRRTGLAIAALVGLVVLVAGLAGCTGRDRPGDGGAGSGTEQAAELNPVATPDFSEHDGPELPTTAAGSAPEQLKLKVLAKHPHDPTAFTQGLFLHDGELYESTGINGQSSLRRVDPRTGEVRQKIDVPADFFAEGLARVDDRLIQLTWQNHKVFEYDRASFEKTGEHTNETEGWGLCYDGERLVMSDGSSTLFFRDPDTFAPIGQVPVTLAGQPQDMLNELECVGNQVYANVWQTDTIVRIDPGTGAIGAVIDAAGLLTPDERSAGADVLNGIAWDPALETFIITGKLWPWIYEVQLEPK